PPAPGRRPGGDGEGPGPARGRARGPLPAPSPGGAADSAGAARPVNRWLPSKVSPPAKPPRLAGWNGIRQVRTSRYRPVGATGRGCRLSRSWMLIANGTRYPPVTDGDSALIEVFPTAT